MDESFGAIAPLTRAALQNERTAENGIEWVGPASFGDQYGVARADGASGPAGVVDSLDELSDFVHEHPDEATCCGDAEFMDRQWEAFQDYYDARFNAADVYRMSLASNYVNVAKADPCNFAEVFTTDARLKSMDLQVDEDTDVYSTTQLAAITVHHETAEAHPELGEALDEETVISLNGMVDIDGLSADEAALYFLRQEGFIG